MKAYRRVVVATDFSTASRAAIGAVEAIGGKGTLVVELVHVLEPVVYGLPAAMIVELIRARRESAQADLARLEAQLAKRLGEDVVVHTHVVEGAPAIEVCRIAVETRAHLVIVGSHGRTGFRRAMIGSVAERIARHAGRPVLIVPGAGSHRRPRR